MLKDFLTNNEEEVIVMENASVMAAMLGEEDVEIAIEGVSEIAEKFKGRVGSIVSKVKAFIQKVVTWIKEKFFELLKRNMEVDQDLWKDAQEVLDLCDKAQLGLIGKFITKIKGTVAIKRENLESYMKLKAEVEDGVEKVKSSEAYIRLTGRKYKYDEEGANFKVFSGKQLSGQNTKFQEVLKTLQEESNSIEKNMTTSDDTATKHLELQFAAVKLAIDITNVRIETINKIFSMSKTHKKAE